MNITEAFNRESRRVSNEVTQALKDGFQIWHEWRDGNIEEGDQVKQFGMVTLVKPHGRPRKNIWPENMGDSIKNLL